MTGLPGRLAILVAAAAGLGCLGWGERCEAGGAPLRVTASEPLRVSNVDPPTPLTGRETWLVVFGQGFSEDEAKVQVFLGEPPKKGAEAGAVKAEEVRVQSPQRLKARFPASTPPGAASVTVCNPDGETATLRNAVYFRPADGSFSTPAMLFKMRHDWRGFLEWFKLGGPLMYVLALISFFAVAWAIHCTLVLRRSQILPRRFMRALSSHLQEGDTKGATRTCEASQCAFSRVILAGLRKLGEPADKIREAITAAGSREAAHLHQKLSYLANVGTISPMLGLLGTVFGMIMAFNIISSGEVRHYLLAAAIAQAMVTTAAGLVIGIPAFAVYFYLRGRLLRLLTHMEVVADEVGQAIIEKGEEE